MNYLLTTTFRLEPAVPRTWPDEYLDYWGAIYLANPQLRTLQITFDQFLQQPGAILRAAVYHELAPLPDGARFYPLLPRQRAFQEQIDFVRRLDAGEA